MVSAPAGVRLSGLARGGGSSCHSLSSTPPRRRFIICIRAANPPAMAANRKNFLIFPPFFSPMVAS